MRKVTKVSLSLGTLGVLMIIAAIFLQYRSFAVIEKDAKVYEKLSLKDTKNIVTEVIEDQSMPLAGNETIQEGNETEMIDQDSLKNNGSEEASFLYEDVATIPVEPIVYDNLTLNELADKLNRSLKSTISGQGYLIASYSLQLGIDPYLATAIILHETGCNSGTCSSLVLNCNNVGGQKGGPSCGGGAYKAYPTLEEGIIGYIDNLYKNYVSYGLTTAEAMGPKYAASSTWASQVNNYISLIRSR